MSVNTDGGTSDPIRPDLSHVHILFDLLSNVGQVEVKANSAQLALVLGLSLATTSLSQSIMGGSKIIRERLYIATGLGCPQIFFHTKSYCFL